MLDKLTALADSLFFCEAGPWKAFFSLPQCDGSQVRAIYVVYSVVSHDGETAYDWMAGVLRVLSEKGGEYLYWRNPECFRINETDAGEINVYTRLVVLDKSLNPVTLPDMIRLEGTQPHRVEKGEAA